MPTSQWSARALLSALLLLGPVPFAGAQRSAPAAPRAAPAPRAAEAAKAQSQRSVFTGDHTVQQGETVQDVVVVGGDLQVRGTVTGDVVVVGGNVLLESSGLIEGDATVTGGTVIQNGGRIRGEMRTLEGGDHVGPAIQGSLHEGAVAAGQEREVNRVVRVHEPRTWPFGGRASRLGAVGDGFLGLISTLALGLVLAGIGAVLVFYGRSYLDTVSDTLRASTLRSGAVGLAASFLVIPAFVVLVVALAVSIIGIPFLLLAVPLYPLAVAAAAGMGLLGAAHAIGERTSEQRNESFDFRYRNSYAYLFTGLGMLLAPLVAANLIEMTGFLGFIGVLLKVVTCTVIWAAATIGFGAVILSRGGTRRTFVGRPLDLGFDTPSGFDTEPPTAPHV